MKKVGIIGECMIELNGAPFADMWQTYGGDTLNSSVYLSRSAGDTVQVNYITAMGEDSLSEGMLTRWQAEGINTQYVLRDKDRQPGLYLIQVDDLGERTFLYWRNQSAARYLVQHPQFPKLKSQLEEMDLIYLSGISLAILPKEDRDTLLSMLKGLSDKGIEIAFDSNFRPALWPQEANWETVRNTYQQLLSFCDLALVTFDDEQAIWQDTTPNEALKRLQKSGVKKAVVKLGVDGCLYQSFTEQDKPEQIPTTPVDHVVDTTSAGDAFNAGFLSGYLLGLKPKIACMRGNQLAGAVIQHKGAIIPKIATDVVTNTFSHNKD